jgi:hypothetical protein
LGHWFDYTVRIGQQGKAVRRGGIADGLAAPGWSEYQKASAEFAQNGRKYKSNQRTLLGCWPGGGVPMSDDEIQSRVTDGGPSYFKMNDAFCARMRMAIEAGLENAPTGVVTTPGTRNPKYVSTEHLPLVSSPGVMDV